MKKVTKTMFCIFLALLICFAASCKPVDDPGDNTDGHSDFPSEPELSLSDPQSEMPDVSDEELLGK